MSEPTATVEQTALPLWDQVRGRKWGLEPITLGRLPTPQTYVHFREETRPGRGHDVVVVGVVDERIAFLHMDPYGNGFDYSGAVDWDHNASFDDPCECVTCAEEVTE